ncbi:MAG: glycosyltransferase [Anaerolineales bacterium]|nr:MAG: glycosyltransferase [Anaerolineales bacterium]
MKILFLTPQVPYPPEKGTALRNWGLISNLAARHDVAVLSFVGQGQQAEMPAELTRVGRAAGVQAPTRTVGERLWGMLSSRRPDMALRLLSETYRRMLAEWLAEEAFDVAHVEGIEMAPYLDVLESAADRPLIVFDDHNCEYLLQRRVFLSDLGVPARWAGAFYSLVQWRRLRKFETAVCRRADRVLAVSEADAEALRRLVASVEIDVVPNGVDTESYRPVPHREEEHSLVFTGTMDYRPNVDGVLWFVRDVLPRVREVEPRAHLYVVGQRPHRRLQALVGEPGVTVTGRVEDVRPYIARASVYVAPLRSAGGTRLKLLEAMAMGKAVVATHLAAEGYPVADGEHMLLAHTAADFAAAVVKLLRDPARRESLGRVGRAFAEQGYDWRAIVPMVEEAYRLPQARRRAKPVTGGDSGGN